MSPTATNATRLTTEEMLARVSYTPTQQERIMELQETGDDMTTDATNDPALKATKAPNDFVFTSKGMDTRLLRAQAGFGNGVGGSASEILHLESSAQKQEREKEKKFKRVMQQMAAIGYLDQLIEKIDLRLGEINTELTSLRDRQKEIGVKRRELKSEQEDVQNDKEEAVQSIGEEENNIDNLKKQKGEIEGRIEAQENKGENADKRLKNARDPIEAQNAIDNKENAIKAGQEAQKELIDCNHKLSDAQQRLEVLNKAVKGYDDRLEEIKIELKGLYREETANADEIKTLEDEETQLKQDKIYLENPELRRLVEASKITPEEIQHNLSESSSKSFTTTLAEYHASVTKTINSVTDTVSGAVDSITGTVSSAVDSITGTVSSAVDSVTSAYEWWVGAEKTPNATPIKVGEKNPEIMQCSFHDSARVGSNMTPIPGESSTQSNANMGLLDRLNKPVYPGNNIAMSTPAVS